MKSVATVLSKALIAFIFLPGFSYAAVMSGQLDPARVNWHSAVSVDGGVSPALWDLPVSLPVGDSIIPGGYVSPSGSMTVELSNAEGDKIEVPITIKGIQYRLSSSLSESKESTGANTHYSGNTATVVGSGSGDKRIYFDTENSMITSYRPIISDIEAATLLTLLENKMQGTYRGRVYIPFQYDYYRNDIRIRQLITLPLDIRVSYAPAFIMDATITYGADGKLTPRYHGSPDVLVSGSGEYGVRITGDFALGLKATVDSVGKRYLLKNTEDELSEIAYSVVCTKGCLSGEKVLIDNGDATSAEVQLDNENTKEANIILNVNFSDKPYGELVPGLYQGHFRLIFEAEI